MSHKQIPKGDQSKSLAFHNRKVSSKVQKKNQKKNPKRRKTIITMRCSDCSVPLLCFWDIYLYQNKLGQPSKVKIVLKCSKYELRSLLAPFWRP